MSRREQAGAATRKRWSDYKYVRKAMRTGQYSTLTPHGTRTESINAEITMKRARIGGPEQTRNMRVVRESFTWSKVSIYKYNGHIKP